MLRRLGQVNHRGAPAESIGRQVQRHSDRFPALLDAMTTATSDGGQDRAFEFGLDRILDGLGLLLAQRGN